MNINGGMYNILNDYTADGRKLSSRHTSCPPNGRGGYYRIHSGTDPIVYEYTAEPTLMCTEPGKFPNGTSHRVGNIPMKR